MIEMELPEVWQLIIDYSDDLTALIITLLSKRIRNYVDLRGLTRPANLDLAATFPMVKRLKRLDLSGDMKVAPSTLWQLVFLEQLDISCNPHIRDVSHLTELRTLNASGVPPHLCRLTQDGLKGLNKLTHLNISSNPYIDDLNHLKQLREVVISFGCRVGPEGISRLNRLVKLDATCNFRFNSIPKLPQLSHIRHRGITCPGVSLVS
jgi:Leucine-rich repeat (LRR) protein